MLGERKRPGSNSTIDLAALLSSLGTAPVLLGLHRDDR
jgi:hypothetical protein